MENKTQTTVTQKPTTKPQASIDLSALRKIVSEFREGILNDNPSEKMCYAVCAPLQTYLSFTNGLDTALVYGNFKVKDGVLEHFWLRLSDGSIIDPTADQLKDHGFPLLPQVYIGPKPSFYP